MFRRVKQWLVGSEIETLAKEVGKYRDVVEELAHKGEGLDLKLDRLRNRVNMRLTRSGVGRAERTDEEIMDEIRARGGEADNDWMSRPPQVWG